MSKIEVRSNLNSRQFTLYEYLKRQGDVWTTQEEIAHALQHIYIDNDWHIPFHDRKVRHQITNDIRAINESGLIQKVILSSGKGVKIANEKEFDKYISSNINSVLNRLKRLKRMAEKGKRDGQLKFVINGQERPFVEAFIESMEEIS